MDTVTIPLSFYNELISERNKRGVVSIKEALDILGCSRSQFFVLKSEEDTHIRTASVRGKYIRSSIEKEKIRVR